MIRPIQIAGGGLAGLTLGIALRENGMPVTIHEAGDYPRHKVCGEFMSGAGPEILRNLGALPEDRGRWGRTVRFFADGSSSPVLEMPQPAFCISRLVLDQFLAETFRARGGHLITQSRVETNSDREGFVCANGRRADRSQAKTWRYVGLKAHVTGAHLESDLEMHFSKDGYVGLCRLPGNQVNVCGLFRTQSAFERLKETWQEYLGGREGSRLKQNLEGGVFDAKSFCSVAALRMRFEPDNKAVCCVGDAFTMAAPLTGSGMSAAIEAAKMACSPLADFTRAKAGWAETKMEVARQSRDRLGGRTRLGFLVQYLAFTRSGRWTLLALIRQQSRLLPILFRFTSQ